MPVEFEGIDEVVSGFNNVSSEAPTTVGEVISNMAEMFVEGAQDKAPIDTGFLVDNIYVEEIDETHAVIVSAAEYSIFVEEGTWKMSPQPYMEPTAAEIEAEFPQAMEDGITVLINESF